ncbi:hypothetical protein GCM10007036_21570 [Alsobacter metallidurans]|uniref:DUF3606 domain-containing protein n=1 Tax=Alsobacter metallidurans TaxID=340221 RepID=A0A917I7J2_9HYPH|nr:hypothetical protein [Alsobacter metallidurans]GGH19000.1 hypothetical protein GCM10007036_21570 [Alsobacter metallidurans]
MADQTAKGAQTGNSWNPGSESHLAYLAGVYGITAAEAEVLFKEHGSNRKVLDIAAAKLTGRPFKNSRKRGRVSPTQTEERMAATDEAARSMIESERHTIAARTQALREKRLSRP